MIGLAVLGVWLVCIAINSLALGYAAGKDPDIMADNSDIFLITALVVFAPFMSLVFFFVYLYAKAKAVATR